MRLTLLLPSLSLLAAPISSAALVWQGVNNTMYAESNWVDDNGATPAADTINPNVAVTAVTGGLISITGGSASPNNFGGAFILGDDNNLEVGNGKTLASSSGAAVTASGTAPTLALFGGATMSTGAVTGFTGITVADATMNQKGTSGISSAVTYGTFAVSTTGSVLTQFLVNWDMTLSGAANLTLRGGGDPLNNTAIDLSASWTGSIYTTNEAIGDWSNPASSQTWRGISGLAHIDKITVEGAPAVIGSNVQIISDGGSGAFLTVIPEPSSALLGGLGLLALLRRRR